MFSLSIPTHILHNRLKNAGVNEQELNYSAAVIQLSIWRCFFFCAYSSIMQPNCLIVLKWQFIQKWSLNLYWIIKLVLCKLSQKKRVYQQNIQAALFHIMRAKWLSGSEKDKKQRKHKNTKLQKITFMFLFETWQPLDTIHFHCLETLLNSAWA